MSAELFALLCLGWLVVYAIGVAVVDVLRGRP